MTNKVMKHGFVAKMESAIDEETKIKHEDLASSVEAIIFDPSQIGLKISADSVESCYEPIVQSGGKYDIKVSAQSNSDLLSSDVIICSLGARYKGYCANMTRTFMVDAPTKVEKTYNILLSVYNHCLEKMVPGNEFKDVLEAAKSFISEKEPSLLAHLPKSIGFAIGLEFRDPTMVLNANNSSKFVNEMVFNLSIGFHNVPLEANDVSDSKSKLIQKLSVFSMLVGDTVKIVNEGVPEILTKLSKEYSDVSYKIADDEDESGSDDSDSGDDEDAKNEKAKKKAQEDGVRRSNRGAAEKSIAESAALVRSKIQAELMTKRLKEAMKRATPGGEKDDVEMLVDAKELQTYNSTEDYPKDVLSNQVRVDMGKEAMLLPINGQPVPFHISTIKNITMPEADQATWMRINFYIPGGALGKEINKNMQQLVVKHGDKYTFIKEITFRSLNSKNLLNSYQMYQELKKRIKQREQKVEQEKDLVVQAKLIRIKDQRVPRLQDITMRPQLSGRKCVGILEAHQNGLRFSSTKGELLDIMYRNIKHCIYQPCVKTTMVLVHFHLKDGIMVGKKKHKDIQFYTEVIDASQNIEGNRRSSYDPDELDDEQRERDMKRRLNVAFKEFCQKVEKVAAHFKVSLQIDAPYRTSSFEGVWNKEMVLIQPTTHCLVNLTESPAFVLTLTDVEHVHFERITYSQKNFDITFIMKNLDTPVKQITAIDVKYMDIIQDWLNLVEITYTMGAKSPSWASIIKVYVKPEISAGFFYADKEEDGTPKTAGWLFLTDETQEEGEQQEEGEDEDSEFSAGSDDSSEEESDDSDDSDDSSFASDDDSDEEDDDSDDEEGKSWEELDRDAAQADKEKRKSDERGDRDDRYGSNNKKQRR
jgi:nucleosome binding factor SPN SPT16 subunit